MHDQLFKDLFEAFFGDLLRLVVPELCPHLDLAAARMLRGEDFVDRPRGARREVDLLAEVPAREGEPELVLVHVEVEAAHRRSLRQRMWRYAMQLRLRHDRPVVPILVTVRGGPAGIGRQTVAETLWGQELGRFHFWTLGLSGAVAADFLRRPEPLAWALAALMKHPGSSSRLKLECLRVIARSDLGEVHQLLLTNLVETYLRLDEREQQEFEAMIETEEPAALDLELTWADRLILQGRRQALREVILKQLERRFGALPDAVVRGIDSIVDPAELDRLVEKAISIERLDDLDLP